MRYPVDKRDENSVELESQFIMRLPPEPSRILREAIRSGVTNFKDRVTIRLENDVRYGEVRIDHYLLHAKVVDLPTIIESLKTIDGKSFYKTADICQMLICKEEEDQATTDDETTSKQRKKDPNKVEKKFLWSHGITPPLKNVRRRRFRKTLKKKFVEQPEIEKEVKRLLRIDNDAVSVKWEVIIDEDEQKGGGQSSNIGGDNESFSGVSIKEETVEDPLVPVRSIKSEANNPNESNVDVEQEIFGSAVSDSEDENINVMDIDESSRLSGDDSRIYDSDSQGRMNMGKNTSRSELITEFSKEMFSHKSHKPVISTKTDPEIKHGIAATSFSLDQYKSENLQGSFEGLKSEGTMSEMSELSREQILARIDELQSQLADLKLQQQQQEMELTTIENQALRQRFQEMHDRLLQDMYEKELELQDLQRLL